MLNVEAAMAGLGYGSDPTLGFNPAELSTGIMRTQIPVQRRAGAPSDDDIEGMLDVDGGLNSMDLEELEPNEVEDRNGFSAFTRSRFVENAAPTAVQPRMAGAMRGLGL